MGLGVSSNFPSEISILKKKRSRYRNYIIIITTTNLKISSHVNTLQACKMLICIDGRLKLRPFVSKLLKRTTSRVKFPKRENSISYVCTFVACESVNKLWSLSYFSVASTNRLAEMEWNSRKEGEEEKKYSLNRSFLLTRFSRISH